MDRPLTIEQGSTRFGRALRENRLQIALVVALVEGILVLLGEIPWWSVIVVAVVAVALYVWGGRTAGRVEVREISWIFAVSQVAVVLVPALAFGVVVFAVIALVLAAVVALVVLLRDRR
jgi:hypothetical protein